jgi:serine/threonine-protein kinase RsbW
MEQRLQVRVDGDEVRSIIEAHGAVDMVTAPRLGTIIRAAAHHPNSLVILDLRKATYLDHSGVAALMSEQASTSSFGAGFEVQVRAGSQPDRVLHRAGAHRWFSVVVWESPPGDSQPQTSPASPAAVLDKLELRIPSDVSQAPRVRHLTEQVLLLMGLDDAWISEFMLAIGEAVANAVCHGSPPGSAGYLIFRLVPTVATVIAEIQDFGPGISALACHAEMPPPESIRGRGMAMMQVFADDMDILTGSTGTTVRLHKHYCSEELRTYLRA